MMKVIIEIEKYEVDFLTRHRKPLLIVGKNFPELDKNRNGFKGMVYAEVEGKTYRFNCAEIKKLSVGEKGYFVFEANREKRLHWYLNQYATKKLGGDVGFLIKVEDCRLLRETPKYENYKYADDEYLDCREDKRWEIAEKIFEDYGIPFETNKDARNLEWLIRYGKTAEEKDALVKIACDIAYNFLADNHQALLGEELRKHLEEKMKKL